jgi:hypothetical protein
MIEKILKMVVVAVEYGRQAGANNCNGGFLINLLADEWKRHFPCPTRCPPGQNLYGPGRCV